MAFSHCKSKRRRRQNRSQEHHACCQANVCAHKHTHVYWHKGITTRTVLCTHITTGVKQAILTWALHRIIAEWSFRLFFCVPDPETYTDLVFNPNWLPLNLLLDYPCLSLFAAHLYYQPRPGQNSAHRICTSLPRCCQTLLFPDLYPACKSALVPYIHPCRLCVNF